MTNLNNELLNLRNHIDQIDKDLILLIAERFRTAKSIGKIKSKINLEVSDIIRENELIQKLSVIDPIISKEFVNQLWSLIITESKKIQALG